MTTERDMLVNTRKWKKFQTEHTNHSAHLSHNCISLNTHTHTHTINYQVLLEVTIVRLRLGNHTLMGILANNLIDAGKDDIKT